MGELVELLTSEQLMDDGSLKLEDAKRVADANLNRKVEYLRSKADQHIEAARHLNAEANRLVDEANEHPLQHKD